MLSRYGPVTRLPVTDLLFQSLFAFFMIELDSRRVIHVGVTRSPSDAWVARTSLGSHRFCEGPKYLIRDNDGKCGANFARVAKTSHIEILTPPYQAPRANAICERFLGSVRRECLDHLLVLHEKQLHRVLNAYGQSFNQDRPHQGIWQQIPEQKAGSRSSPSRSWVDCIMITAEVPEFFHLFGDVIA
jgi:putative transposase